MSRKKLRAAYAIVMFVLTLLTALHGLGEKFGDVPGRVIVALSAIDPFFILKDMFRDDGGQINLCESLRRSSFGVDMDSTCEPIERGWIALFHQGGWLALLLVGGPVLAFWWFMLHAKLDPKTAEFMFLLALPLPGFVSFGLKWLLIGLMYAVGAAIGFVLWIGLTGYTALEAFLHVHDVVKGAAEAKQAIKEVHHPKS